MTTLSIETDFGGQFNIGQFDQEIKDSAITVLFGGINLEGDMITLLFAEELGEEDQIILTTLIENHNPIYIKPRKNKNMILTDLSTVSSTTYTTISTFIYDGTDTMVLDYVDVLAKISGSGTYDLRLINTDGSILIAQVTGLSNTDFEIVDLGTLSNLPTDRSIFELQAKTRNKNRTATFRQIILYSDN